MKAVSLMGGRRGQSRGILAASINTSWLLTGCGDIGWVISFWPDPPRGSIGEERRWVQFWVVWPLRTLETLLNIESRSLRLKKETGARKIRVLLEASGNWSSGYRCTCPGKRAEKRMEGNTQTSSPGKPHVLSSFHIVLALSGRRLPFPTFMYQKPILVGSKTCLRFFLLSGPIEPGTQLELSKWRVSIADTEENQEASVTYRHCCSI